MGLILCFSLFSWLVFLYIKFSLWEVKDLKIFFQDMYPKSFANINNLSNDIDCRYADNYYLTLLEHFNLWKFSSPSDWLYFISFERGVCWVTISGAQGLFLDLCSGESLGVGKGPHTVFGNCDMGSAAYKASTLPPVLSLWPCFRF